jgi:hypothetical protein
MEECSQQWRMDQVQEASAEREEVEEEGLNCCPQRQQTDLVAEIQQQTQCQWSPLMSD